MGKHKLIGFAKKIALVTLMGMTCSIIDSPLETVEAYDAEVYQDGKGSEVESNPLGWVQLQHSQLNKNYAAGNPSTPSGASTTVLGNEANTLETSGCSYYALSFARIRHGSQNPASETVVDLCKKLKSSGGMAGDFGPVNWGSVADILDDVSFCSNTSKQGMADNYGIVGQRNPVSQIKKAMDDGYYVILCFKSPSSGNESTGERYKVETDNGQEEKIWYSNAGHYVFVDSIENGEIKIADSIGEGSSWYENYGKFKDCYIAHYTLIKFADGKGPNDTETLWSRYGKGSSSSSSSNQTSNDTSYSWEDIEVCETSKTKKSILKKSDSESSILKEATANSEGYYVVKKTDPVANIEREFYCIKTGAYYGSAGDLLKVTIGSKEYYCIIADTYEGATAQSGNKSSGMKDSDRDATACLSSKDEVIAFYSDTSAELPEGAISKVQTPVKGSANATAATSTTSKKINGKSYTLYYEWELTGMPEQSQLMTDADRSKTLVMGDESLLTEEQKANKSYIGSEIENRSSTTRISKLYLYSTVAILGFTIYLLILALAQIMDEATITHTGMVRLLTFNKIEVLPKGVEKNINRKDQGTHRVTRRRFWGVLTGLFILNIVLLSGWFQSLVIGGLLNIAESLQG